METLLAPGLRCQRLGCGHTYQRWHTRLYSHCPSNPQSHSALAIDPPRPQQAVPSQEPRRATTPVRSVHTPSPCDVERDAHFEQRMQDSLPFRTQDGNPVSVIMIYLGRGGNSPAPMIKLATRGCECRLGPAKMRSIAEGRRLEVHASEARRARSPREPLARAVRFSINLSIS